MAEQDKIDALMNVRRPMGMRRSFGEIVFDNANVLVMIIFATMTLYPLWYVLINSLNEGRDAALGGIWFIPRKWSLNNYTFVFNDTMRNAYMITIGRTVAGS